MIRHLVGGREVRVWPEAFSGEECAQLIGRVPWREDAPTRGMNTVLHHEPMAKELGYLCAPRMVGAPELDWLDDLTLTVNYRLGWHFDPARGATHKCILYLEADEGAGIQFGVDQPGPRVLFNVREGPVVRGTPGTLVLFDIYLAHRAVGLASGPRRVVGLRARVGA